MLDRAAFRGRRARDDGDRQRPRRRATWLEQLAAGDEPLLAPTAGRWPDAACASRCSSCPRRRSGWRGSSSTCPSLPGSGIVYTLTKRDAEQVAGVPDGERGIAALAYSGEQETEARIATEERLLRNEVKAVVATSALGMGYDKAGPDLRRALPGARARSSPTTSRSAVPGAASSTPTSSCCAAARTAGSRTSSSSRRFPARERVAAVLDELERRGRGRAHDAGADGGGQPRHGPDRGDAEDPRRRGRGAPRRARRWCRSPAADWTYDAERYAQVTALRRAEQRAMAAFGSDGRCLMRVLQEELDDPAPADCGRCSVCTGPRFAAPLDPALVEAAGRHLRSTPIELEVKKMAPDAAGAMRKIPEDVRVEPGWALARFGDGGWWPAVERGLRAGEFEDEVVAALADIVRARGRGVAWVTTVPSARLGGGDRAAGERLAAALAVATCGCVERVEERPPQREMANAAQQVANVRGAFASWARRRPGRACCSMIGAARAGRSRWSAGSSGGPAPTGSSRWRWPPCSSRRRIAPPAHRTPAHRTPAHRTAHKVALAKPPVPSARNSRLGRVSPRSRQASARVRTYSPCRAGRAERVSRRAGASAMLPEVVELGRVATAEAARRPPTSRPARRPRCGASAGSWAPRARRPARYRRGSHRRSAWSACPADQIQLLDLVVEVSGALLEVRVRWNPIRSQPAGRTQRLVRLRNSGPGRRCPHRRPRHRRGSGSRSRWW